MSLATLSKFYYGFTVDSDNYQMDFKEGGGAELTAALNFGDYTLTEFVAEIKRALDEAGALTYTVTVARSTRLITINGGSTISLLTTSGTNGNALYTLMGFTGADRTGSSSYTGNAATGSAYTTQYMLQDYVSPDDCQVRKNVTNQETASGLVESVSFGDLEMIEMNIRFATNIVQPTGGPITNSTTGVADLNALMRFLITKAPCEFMPDKDTAATYYKVILESTQMEKMGTSYKLKERFDLKLPGYYDSEKLTFRVIEE